MLGSHDSYTYMEARNPLVNAVSGTWRTQSKSINEQYKAGVRFFDVRVCRDGDRWRCCHGAAEFDKVFSSLKAICNYFDVILKCRYQIWLEKGSDADWEMFKKEAGDCLAGYEGVTQFVRKDGEDIFYRCPDYPHIIDYTFRDWNAISVIKGVFGSPIKRWAEENNPEITAEIIEDDDICFIDFV